MIIFIYLFYFFGNIFQSWALSSASNLCVRVSPSFCSSFQNWRDKAELWLLSQSRTTHRGKKRRNFGVKSHLFVVFLQLGDTIIVSVAAWRSPQDHIGGGCCGFLAQGFDCSLIQAVGWSHPELWSLEEPFLMDWRCPSVCLSWQCASCDPFTAPWLQFWICDVHAWRRGWWGTRTFSHPGHCTRFTGVIQWFF